MASGEDKMRVAYAAFHFSTVPLSELPSSVMGATGCGKSTVCDVASENVSSWMTENYLSVYQRCKRIQLGRQ